MKKWLILCGLLTALSGFIFTKPTTFVHADSWHAGTPKIFHQNHTIWVSDYQTTKEAQLIKAKYERDLTTINAKLGINFTPFYYNANHQYINNGADTSAFAGQYPHYKALGHQKYLLTAGSISKKNSLYYELHNTLDHMFGTMNLIHVYNHDHIKVWTAYQHHGQTKYGYAEDLRAYPSAYAKTLMHH